jgi:hypothetical protein
VRDLLMALFFIFLVLSPAFVGMRASRQVDPENPASDGE